MIGLVGLDHHWAPAEVRGRLSFVGERQLAALRALVQLTEIREAVLLSTCSRTEVYVATADWPAARAAVERLFALSYALDPHESLAVLPAAQGETVAGASVAGVRTAAPAAGAQVAPGAEPEVALESPIGRYLYTVENAEAARHLLRVAAGLRSMLVGESQILGQVREAFLTAERAGTTGEELRPLFAQALQVGKRARAGSWLGRVDRSLARAAVQLAGESLGGLAGKAALLIGAGLTSQLCARQLRAEGIGRLVLANRTPGAAAEVAAEVGAETVALDDLCEALDGIDLVISATAAPHAVLSAATVACGLHGRHTPLVIVDLALPADVEATVGLLPQVSLYTLDQLRQTAAGVSAQGPEVAQAEAVVEDGVRAWARERQVRQTVPGIAALRRHVERSEQAERERILAELAHLSAADQQIVARFGQRLVDKMFHYLVVRIRALAEYDEVSPEITLRVLEQLFADPDQTGS